jgi:hypothetical protein
MPIKPEPKKNRRLPINNSPSARAKRMGVEGPKRSVAKPTAAQSAAAKKSAAVKKSAAEGPKRSRVKPSALAMSVAKGGKPRVVESGVGNIPMSLARLGAAIVKSKTVINPGTGKAVPRTKNMQKGMAKLKADNKKSTKDAIKSGKIKQPFAGPKGFKSSGSVASKQKKVPKKYGYM